MPHLGGKQGGKQPIKSTEFDEMEAGTPKTGFSTSGKAEKPGFGPGPGKPKNNHKIR